MELLRSTDSDILAVGETAALTITVRNAAPDPAHNLTVTLPTPDGALALPSAGTLGPLTGWRWTTPQLDANSSTALTGTLRLIGRPAGDALLLTAQATADGVTVPAQASGGALVVARGVGNASFTPGCGVTLRSADGRVTVQLPARAAAGHLALRHRNLADALAELRAAKRPLPPAIANGRRSFGAFVLDATDDQGADIHQFSQPLTITVGYSPEQLQLLGIVEGELQLFWFDEAVGRWTPLQSQRDPAARTLSASVDHFSVYTIGDGLSPSTAFIPTLQGFQVSSFTGAASYSYPIEAPAGPGGLKPDLTLSYSSAASDGTSGERPKWQAGWTGKGWSLDPGGAVTLNKSVAGDNWNNFSLVFGGRSFDIVRGQPTSVVTNGNPCNSYADTASLQCWTWYAVDEQFVRVRPDFVGNVTVGTAPNTATYATYVWHAWTKDGTRYDFGLNSNVLWTLYRNFQRVTQALAQDLTGTGKSALTTYSYQQPAVNDYNHAATVVYAQYPPSGNGDSRQFLARPENHEFRGHAQVIETHYDGATTSAAKLHEVWHSFYQGYGGTTGCLPVVSPPFHQVAC